MTTFAGGIGFLMMLLGTAGACNEDMGALTVCLGIYLVGVVLLYVSCKLEERKKHRYIKNRF